MSQAKLFTEIINSLIKSTQSQSCLSAFAVIISIFLPFHVFLSATRNFCLFKAIRGPFLWFFVCFPFANAFSVFRGCRKENLHRRSFRAELHLRKVINNSKLIFFAETKSFSFGGFSCYHVEMCLKWIPIASRLVCWSSDENWISFGQVEENSLPNRLPKFRAR
jgi:hypothetical protein